MPLFSHSFVFPSGLPLCYLLQLDIPGRYEGFSLSLLDEYDIAAFCLQEDIQTRGSSHYTS